MASDAQTLALVLATVGGGLALYLARLVALRREVRERMARLDAARRDDRR